MPIEELLKSVRKELNLSQESLARALHVSYATLNRWENSKAKPSRLALKQLKDFCVQNNISREINTELEELTRF